MGVLGYPPARVDHRFKDGDTIRVGPIELTAVSVCDTGVWRSRYPEQAADRERSIRVLRGLSADIWVTNHARAWGRYHVMGGADDGRPELPESTLRFVVGAPP